MNGTITTTAVKSQRKNMSDIAYTQFAISEARAWGNSVEFHLRHRDVKEAVRTARLAARWALKVIGDDAVPSDSAWVRKQKVTVKYEDGK
jgi:hypothetical protein